ncbi:MAG: T9SS type A sorting domain-containing protein [Candidatus Krumholzibacteriota bacterium]|nr:T9SS type A sorting domain-containing protein [Candidatus Krumholzibacteriota bacterium]
MTPDCRPFVRRSPVAALTAILLVLLAAAPAGAAFQITRSVIANGGGHCANGTSSVDGTAGQSAIGVMSGPSHQHHAGFWYCGSHPTAVDGQAGLPAVFALMPNRPNPFNPVTTIRYAVPAASEVRLRVFDVRGRLVATLADGPHAPGYHEITFRADALPSGVYLYRMESDAFASTRKLVLLK